MKNVLATFILDDAKAITSKVSFDEVRNKSILITGASGLVGHYILAALHQAAIEGNRPSDIFLVVKNALPDYFTDLLGDLPVKIISGDLTNDEFLNTLPEADYIIHGAGYGQPGKFMIDMMKTIELNTVATIKILNKLKRDGKFLFLSTSEVYSGLPNPPFNEQQIGTTNTNHPRACYIEGKRCGEAIVNVARSKNINAKSARLSLAYGPGTRTDDNRVLNSFIRKAYTENGIKMMDHGEAFRTYIYVTDSVEFMFRMLFDGKCDIYNIGGKSRTTIKELAQQVGKILNVPVTLPEGAGAGMVGAPDDVFVDMTRPETEFSKTDYISLEDGLKRTINWQKHLY